MNLMAMDSLKRLFVGTVKISLATVLNYYFCLGLAAIDKCLALQDIGINTVFVGSCDHSGYLLI